jgi:hypothetical protein
MVTLSFFLKHVGPVPRELSIAVNPVTTAALMSEEEKHRQAPGNLRMQS